MEKYFILRRSINNFLFCRKFLTRLQGAFQLGTLESCCAYFSLRFTYRILQLRASEDVYANGFIRRLYQLIMNSMICVKERKELSKKILSFRWELKPRPFRHLPDAQFISVIHFFAR